MIGKIRRRNTGIRRSELYKRKDEEEKEEGGEDKLRWKI